MSKVTVFNTTDQPVKVTERGELVPGYGRMDVDDTDPVLVKMLLVGEVILVDDDGAAPVATTEPIGAPEPSVDGDGGDPTNDPKKKSSKAKEN
jgi:hypothetical protein